MRTETKNRLLGLLLGALAAILFALTLLSHWR